jgi:hypothetical protein
MGGFDEAMMEEDFAQFGPMYQTSLLEYLTIISIFAGSIVLMLATKAKRALVS